MGAKSAERAPMATSTAPSRSFRHMSKRSRGVRPEWRTATSSPKRARKRPTSCGVSAISGTNMIDPSFRSFAELCITRQIITAIKTATRNKHVPLNSYVSFSHTPAGRDVDVDCTIGDCLPGSEVEDPAVQVVSTQELRGLVDHMTTRLSGLESQVLTGYLEGRSYEQIAEAVGCDPKTVDNALQRVKRKVGEHLESRRIPDA